MSRGNVRVRIAGPDDVEAFVALVREMRENSGSHTKLPRAGVGGDDGIAVRFARLLDHPGARVLFAIDHGTDQPLGFAVVTEDEVSALAGTPVVHMGHLFVSPAHRRRGAGRALVTAATSHAEALGCDHVMVGVTAGGRDANRFFARLGFAPLVTRRIAAVGTLRRTLGMTEHDVDGHVVRRRALRPVRLLPRPAPIQRLRGGAT